MTRNHLTAAAVLLTTLALLPLAALAQTLAPVANAAIDQAQPTVVEWIVGSVTSVAAIVLTWFGRLVGIKIVEKLNRDALATATRNFANSVIDELQLRYFGTSSGIPDLSDLIDRGLGYVTSGSSDAIRESRITDVRLRKQVEGALRAKGNDLMAAALRDAGAPAVDAG